MYNASNNELVRTKSLVKGCIVQIDATPFKAHYTAHYGLPKDFFSKGEPQDVVAAASSKVQRKREKLRKGRKLEQLLVDQLIQGALCSVFGTECFVCWLAFALPHVDDVASTSSPCLLYTSPSPRDRG